MQEGSELTYDDHLDAAEALADMAQQLMDKLPDVSIPTPGNVREDVALMIRHYIEGAYCASVVGETLQRFRILGQRDILQSLIEYAGAKEWHGDIPAEET